MPSSATLLLLLATLAGAATGCGPDATATQAPSLARRRAGLEPTERVRVMAANLTSGRGGYDDGHGTRVFQGVQPDIVLIQEFNYRDETDEDLRAFVDEAFGADYAFVREPTGRIPNGIISRYPVLESGQWNDPTTTDRDFAWARLDVPGPTDLWAVSVHFLTSNATKRQQSAQALVRELRRAVPEGDFVVVGGDFNTRSRQEKCLQVLDEWVNTSGPFPVDNRGNGNTNRARNKPYDWVLVDAALEARQVPVEVGNEAFEHGLVVDSRVYAPLSSLHPVQKDDSGAPQMQHMAVVRDFELDADTDAP